MTENIHFKAEFTLSSSSVKVGFTDITISILEKSHSLHFSPRPMAPIKVFVRMQRTQRSHGYYCPICPFSSGGEIIQKLDPVPRVNSCSRGFCCCVKLDSSYQVSKIAEIFWVNEQGALEKQLDPGR